MESNSHDNTCHHGHHHNHHHHHSAGGNLLFAFLLNLFFAIVELIGGLLTQSVAILSDALHDFGDSISLGIAWRLQKISERGRDTHFSYGYKRFSLMGALLISLILLVGSVFVIYACIERIRTPHTPNAQGMLILAIFGLIVNGAAAIRLSKGSSLNERAVRLHLMEDVLGWIAVLAVSVVMLFVYVPILDPLLSLAITAWILVNVYRNLRDTFKVLLQGIPENIHIEKLLAEINDLPGVCSTHDVHLWTLDGEEHVMTIHIVYDASEPNAPETTEGIKQSVRHISSRAGIKHLTIEIDRPEDRPCGFEHC